MKTTINFFSTIILIIAISYSSAVACGEMGNGSRDCSVADGNGIITNQPTITTVQSDEKDEDNTRDGSEKESVLDFVKDFLVNFFA